MSSCVACGAPAGEVGVACGLCGTVRQPTVRGISLTKEPTGPAPAATVQPAVQPSIEASGQASIARADASSQTQSWQRPPQQVRGSGHATPAGPLGAIHAPVGLRSAAALFAIAAGLGLLNAFPALRDLQGALGASELRTPDYLYPLTLSTVAAVLFAAWSAFVAWSAGRGRSATGWSAAVLAVLAVAGLPGDLTSYEATARTAALGGCAALAVARRAGHPVGGDAIAVLRGFQLSVTCAATAASVGAVAALPRVSAAGAAGVFTLLFLVASAAFGWIAYSGLRRSWAKDSRVYATGAVIGLLVAVLLCPSGGLPRPVAFTFGSTVALAGLLWLVPQCREWFGDARTSVVPVPDELRAFVRPSRPSTTAARVAPAAAASGAQGPSPSASAGYMALTRSGWNRALLAGGVCAAVAVVGVMSRRPGGALLIDIALTIWLAGVVFARAWVPSRTSVVVGVTSAAMNILRPSGGMGGDGSAVVGAERRGRTAAALAAPLAVGLVGALVVGAATVDRAQLCSSYQAASTQLNGYSDSEFFAAISKLGKDASAYDGKDVDSTTTDSIHSAGSRLTALGDRRSVYVYEARSAMAPISSVCLLGE